MRSGADLSARAAQRPAKPPPTMTTWGSVGVMCRGLRAASADLRRQLRFELALVGCEVADAFGQLHGRHRILVVLPAERRFVERCRRCAAIARIDERPLDRGVGFL